MESAIEDQIQSEFENCLRRTLVRISTQDTHRPFHSALMTEEALFWSRFERSFSTSFGQSFVERVSKLVCIAGGADEAESQRATQVTLSTTQWEEIEKIVRDSRAASGYVPSWANDLARVSAAGQFGTPDTRRVIADLWWRKDGLEHFMSIKTVKPNLDQTAEAKRDLLKLAAAKPDAQVYFGLYYNPYGEAREDYNWTPPQNVFDFHSDESVLIGHDYWDTLGGAGTYESIIKIAARAGEATKPLLRAAFTGS